jgi:hypothetical protein
MGLRKDYADDVLAALPVHKVVKARRAWSFKPSRTFGPEESRSTTTRLIVSG